MLFALRGADKQQYLGEDTYGISAFREGPRPREKTSRARSSENSEPPEENRSLKCAGEPALGRCHTRRSPPETPSPRQRVRGLAGKGGRDCPSRTASSPLQRGPGPSLAIVAITAPGRGATGPSLWMNDPSMSSRTVWGGALCLISGGREVQLPWQLKKGRGPSGFGEPIVESVQRTGCASRAVNWN